MSNTQGSYEHLAKKPRLDEAARLKAEQEAKTAKAKADEAARLKAEQEAKTAETARLNAEQKVKDAAAETARLNAEKEKADTDELDVANATIAELNTKIVDLQNNLLRAKSSAPPIFFDKAKLESLAQQCKANSKDWKAATQPKTNTGTVAEGSAGKVTYMCSLPTNEITGGEFLPETRKIKFQVTPLSQDVIDEKIRFEFDNQMTKSGDHKKGEALKGALKFIPSTGDATPLTCLSITVEDNQVKLCFGDHDFTFAKKGDNWKESFWSWSIYPNQFFKLN